MTTKLRSMFGTLPQRLLRDTRGVTLAIVALAASVLIGFTGLGVETGLWYAIQRQNQSAADVAALSGAFELLAGQSNGLSQNAAYPDICNLAERDAARNNFTFNAFSCPATTPACTSPSTGKMCANNPPVLGNLAGNNNAVEVILSQQQNTFFANLFLPNVTIKTRAVAAINVLNNPCILALGTSGTDIGEQGNPTICLAPAPGGVCTPPGTCSIAANSTSQSAISLGGNSKITAYTIVTPGGVTTGGAARTFLVSPAEVGAPPVPDPYAGTLTHAFLTTGMPAAPACTKAGTTWSGNCVVPGGSVNSGDTLSAKTQISGGLSFKGTVHLSPGTYWITDGDLTLQNGGGTLDCPNCTPGGAGVTIILTTAMANNGTVGTLTVGSKGNLNLSAPSSGTFAGLVLIQDSNGLPPGTTVTTGSSSKANATITLNGLVYFPDDDKMSFQGGPATGAASCLVLVVKKVTLQGNPSFEDSGCTNAGLTTLPTVKTVTLAE
jgi:hypothetical protein